MSTSLPLNRADFLALDPATLKEPLPWNVLLSPHLSTHASEWDDRQERRRLGIADHGILDDPKERSQAWATACYVSTTVGDIKGERFRLAAVQTAIREGCGAWHAASIVAGDVERCQCCPCVKAREAA